MEERALRVLEFQHFLQALKAFAGTEVGQALCIHLRPSTDPAEIDTLLQEVAEAIALLREGSDLPLGGLQEVRPLLPRARVEGACLLPEELLGVKSTLGAARRVKKFLERIDRRFALLRDWGERIPDGKDLDDHLNSALGPRGEILDSASPELARVRREIMKARSRIRRMLENLWAEETFQKIFQEEIITLRNERYVVAVKAEYKRCLPGIIHDQSQSKATFFVEPLATVEDNNELNLLLKDEKEEERRILLVLTTEVREEAAEIAQTVETLGHLDLMAAKAKWAGVWKATIPAVRPRGEWHLHQARHPLLDPKQAVPIDLHLGHGQTVLILTGANTGGKTVALKTLGLLTLMAQSGIPIPAAEGSQVGQVQRIFADIGDEQSLKDNLSTFSAWVHTLAKVLREADPSSLILLDEVGGGTDPTEGAALTMALLDRLREVGAKVVVTTHLQLLKAYGAIHQDVVNVSVEFNPHSLQPTYRLVYGRPGDSYALLMAEKWGLPHELIAKARSYLGEDNRKVGELLHRLDQTQREMEVKTQEYERLKNEAAVLREDAEALLEQTKRDQEHLLSKAREKTQVLVAEAKDHLRQLINEFKAKGRTDVHHLRKEIQAEEDRLRLSLAGMFPPSSGERDHPEKKEVHLAPGKNALPSDGKGEVHYEMPHAVSRLKLIGLRVEEGLALVDKGIDDAYLAGLPEIELIHGAGTGKLRQAIREYLGGHRLVKSFRPGGPGQGGDGVTFAEIGASEQLSWVRSRGRAAKG